MKQLGKYLGCNIVHRGNNREAQKALLHCINNRIEAWKIKCLSKARRLTLAQSVLGRIPIFNMQLGRLPSRFLKKLDRAARMCLGDIERRSRCASAVLGDANQPQEIGRC